MVKTSETSLEDRDSIVIETLLARVSPPPVRQPAKQSIRDDKCMTAKPDLAAVEAGKKHIRNHLEYFSAHLSTAVRNNGRSRLSIHDFKALFKRNSNEKGHHFVVHQHDHPVAGLHYDLRLQINPKSSVSWAIMYGLPGNPTSRRGNRNATETRIHCLWNHLIETASHMTGSLLIWDTGEYEVLEYDLPYRSDSTDRESSGEEELAYGPPQAEVYQPMKLSKAFEQGKIRIRLHGYKLPPGYTITLRLAQSSKNQDEQPKMPPRKRRRKTPGLDANKEPILTSDGGDGHGQDDAVITANNVHSDTDESGDSEIIRKCNAYPGSTNTIGSVHQRKWHLSFDRRSTGLERRRDVSGGVSWVRQGDSLGANVFEGFKVRGRDHERSVVTGRLGHDVLADEGVEDYVPRAGWRGIMD